MVCKPEYPKHSGFTLVQISIMLTVASLILVATLPAQQTTLKANADTVAKMNVIMAALRQYQTANAVLPCPADASQPTGSSSYGKAAANSGATNNCSGSTPAANYVDATNHIAIGGVPWRTIGLSSDYALDGYGRALTYAIDTNITAAQTVTGLPGTITVTDNGNAVNTTIALVSHGADGHGAFIPIAGTSGSAVRLNAGSTDSNQLTNAHLNSSFVATTPLNNFVKTAPTSTFDDYVVYSGPNGSVNTAPLAMQSSLFMGSPNNALYNTGNVLTFTVTYPNAVTITGTPRLVLSALGTGSIGTSNTAYANYSSGSGTNKINFTYTVISTDSALTGISMAGYISLNGGTISATNLSRGTGNAGALVFRKPDLSQVRIGSVQYMYVANYNNHTVVKYDLTGTLKLTLGVPGTSGTSTTQFNHPTQAIVDSSGNIWVLDASNNRVMEFSSAGAWIMTIGGSYTDACSGRYATATSCNPVVGDTPANTTCCAPNASSCTCSSGSATGQFNFSANESPSMTFDPGGYLWVTDQQNSRIQQFNPASGKYLNNFSLSLEPNGSSLDMNNNLTVVSQNGGNCKLYSCRFSGVCTPSATMIATSCNGQTDFTATDPTTGNIWVTDELNNNVHKYNSTYVYQGDLPNFAGSFNTEGVAVDGSGYMRLTDSTNNAVKKYDNAGNLLFTISGFNGPDGIFIK